MRKPNDNESQQDYVDAMMDDADARQMWPRGEDRKSFLAAAYTNAQTGDVPATKPVSLEGMKAEASAGVAQAPKKKKPKRKPKPKESSDTNTQSKQ